MDVDMEQEEDCVVEEYDVVVSNSKGIQLVVMGHPLRPPWRPYNYGDAQKLRYKPQAKRIEVDLPLRTAKTNYNNEGEAYKQIDKITLRSQQVEQPALLALGVIQDGRMMLAPVDQILQMRPHLPHLNVTKKENDSGAMEQEEEEAEALRPVEVVVTKRETERQIQARLNSYAHISQQEEAEPWKELKVHMDTTQAADRVWTRLFEPPQGGSTVLPHLSRADYLSAFAPSSFAFADAAADAAAGPAHARDAQHREEPAAAAAAPSIGTLTEATKTAFRTVIQALFARHSVCNLMNVRQWLLEPRHGTEALKAAAATAREVAQFDDQNLHKLVVDESKLNLALIKRVYVLRETGRTEVDAFRKVVIDVLKDKDSVRRQEVTEIANQQGVPVTDSLYSKVLKDLCTNRANTWTLKTGADF